MVKDIHEHHVGFLTQSKRVSPNNKRYYCLIKTPYTIDQAEVSHFSIGKSSILNHISKIDR